MEELSNKQVVTFQIVLKRLLEKKDLKQSDVAKHVGLPQSTFHDWMTGRSPRDLGFVKKIADYFDVEFEYMVFGNKEDRELEKAYRRKLEFENALLKLERDNQMGLFESKEDAIKRIKALKKRVDDQFPDLKWMIKE